MTRLEHLLTILTEECNETGQRVSKAIRFGMQEVQEGQLLTNAERVIYEFNDIVAVMELLLNDGDIKLLFDREAIVAKKQKIVKYMEYAKKCGTITD